MERGRRSTLWWIPLLFALLVAGVGGVAYRTLADAMRARLRSELETILSADVAALSLWASGHEATVRAAAHGPELSRAATELAEILRKAPDIEKAGEALRASPAAARVREALEPVMAEHGYRAYALFTAGSRVLASSHAAVVGRRYPVGFTRFEAAIGGEAIVSRPLPVPAVVGSPQTVAVRLIAPVHGESGESVALLGFSAPVDSFTDVLHIARTGESGETYAFDADGIMVSSSRFDEQLTQLGLLEQGQESILRIQIRDPGGNMVEGFVTETPLLARPLTRMAAAAVSGESGVDIDGYRDYRGVPVVGAWTWVPELEIGVASEVDVEEAYAGLATVQRSFAALAGLLGIGALTMLGYSLMLGRVQARFETARKLGRYRAVEKIGEGGMGKVYRAEHALLRRPTAVKVLEAPTASDEAAKRFEREVQAAASLTHPNTIAIYDYGRTPEGSFYYAMEYLEGIDAAKLVELDGPQPEARVLHLMRQAAASVAEAHASGLIHRDLKPSNLMLCRRGGMLDFVKVLDFGLVRGQEEDLQLTTAESLTGTPLYLSPEALEAPETMDARSDVYQLGAVLYTLLTGRPVFDGKTLVEILSQHLNSSPVPPSEVLGRGVSPDLEKLALTCLAKEPEQRPADAGVLAEALQACRVDGEWTQADARAWWEEWNLRHPAGDPSLSGTGSLPSGWQVDLGARLRRSGSRSRT